MPDGRFAPSPTGPLHLGSLRTALLAWLFARSARRRFLLRIEDLDPVASRADWAAAHIADLQDLGLDWDGPPTWQSAHRPRHDEVVADLIASGLTYPCFCTRREIQDAARAPHADPAGPRRDAAPGPTGPTGGPAGPGPDQPGAPLRPPGWYPGTCAELSDSARRRFVEQGRPPAIRLRASGLVESFTDRLHGTVTGVVDDFVIRRGDGVPSYNLAVVVDDVDQGVQEVVRGDDLLPTTARQVHLTRLIGARPATYAHVPMVLGADGRRLAKRHGAITLAELRADGWTPARIVQLLARSAGLLAPDGDGATRPADLLADFSPDRLTCDPWRLTASTFPRAGWRGPPTPTP